MDIVTKDTLELLAYSTLQGVGAVTLRKVALSKNSAEQAEDELHFRIPIIKKALSKKGAWEKATDEANRQVELAKENKSRIISIHDEDFPPLLKELAKKNMDVPVLLFIKGRLAKESNNAVAIVGTRKPTKAGEIITERISRYFIDQGWSLVSGLALGCDAIAHDTAVKSEAHTVAVLAHGLHMVAPKSNQRLADEIIATGGALISEYPFGHGALAPNFVRRDRIQAALAQGVIMVQSDLDGGSLHAARAALKYDRWLAVPCPIKRDLQNQEKVVRANLLLTQGAEEEVAKLLNCDLERLEKLNVLKSRDEIGRASCRARE